MHARRKIVKKKKPARKKTAGRPARVRLPRYEMPENKRLFRLDVEIGKCLLELSDALPEAEIMKLFKISKRTFNERARKLAPLLKKDETRQIIDLLLEIGRNTALRKEREDERK